MENLTEIKRLYFIGIGGIGMSALARYFAHREIEIYGYDKVSSSLTKKLETEGMIIHYEDDISRIPDGIDMVVYTPAIPNDHKELNWFIDNEFIVVKRAKMLGLISETQKALCIAGTHGKTTTSSMLSHILTYGNKNATSIIGGIMVNYNSNFINGKGNLIVLEADEYDRSFLHLEPLMSAIMSLDPDHLDIYGNYENMCATFQEYSEKIRENGILFLPQGKHDLFSQNWKEKLNSKGVEVIEFGNKGQLSYTNLEIQNGHHVFNMQYKGAVLGRVEMKMPGKHNLENALVAMAIAFENGMTFENIAAALKTFKGIKRRFEWLMDEEDLIVIDDYAHHPTELSSAINAARTLYPEKKITGVFQPHLFSRTDDFKEGFAKSLDLLDEVYLLDIYPARELPIPGVTSNVILERMKNEKKELISKEELVSKLNKENLEVLMILGAGDIDAEIPKIIKQLKK